MKRNPNCRVCSSTGSEKLCSSCSLVDEHLVLRPLYSRPKQKSKVLTAKQLYIKQCVEHVKSLKFEDQDF